MLGTGCYSLAIAVATAREEGGIGAAALSRHVVVLDGGAAATGRTSAVVASRMLLVIGNAVLNVSLPRPCAGFGM